MNRVSAHNYGMAKRSDKHAQFCRELAPRLVIAMRESKLEQAEVARQMGVSRSAVTQWLESGKIQAAQIPGFASATGVSVEWLMTGKGGISPQDKAWLDKLHKLPESEQRRIQSFTDALHITAPHEDSAPESNCA